MSKETKNPLIEAFLKLHELSVGPIARAAAPQLNRTSSVISSNTAVGAGASKPLGEPAQSTGSQQLSFKPTPPRPAMDTAPKPQVSISRDRPPAVDNSASMQRAKTDYQTRVAGAERQNPIAAPGKLEGGNLQMGSRGDSVKELQRKLGVKDDGIFGKDTAAALKAFQQKNNLKVDAIYGRQSASAMNRQSSMDALKKENPVGAYVSSQTVKPMSPMAGQGSSGAGSKTLPVRNNTSAPDISNSNNSLNQLDKNSLLTTAKSRSFDRPAAQKLFTTKFNRDRMESTDIPNKLIEAFMKLQSTNSSDLFAEAKKAKKLDPVGKEDDDIDNDGDKDNTDSYLHNRRKKIAAAMKEAIDPKVRPPVKKDPYGGDETSPSSMGIDKPDYAPAGTTPDYAKPKLKPSVVKQTGKNSSEVYKQQKEEVEQLDEEAFKLTDAHKSAITKHLNRNIGKGKVTFHKEHGGHFATHSDGIQSTVHHIQMKNGKMTLSHFMTMDEEVEEFDEGVGVRNKVRKAILVGAKSAKNAKEHEINKNIVVHLLGNKEAGKTYDTARKMVTKEEVENLDEVVASIDHQYVSNKWGEETGKVKKILDSLKKAKIPHSVSHVGDDKTYVTSDHPKFASHMQKLAKKADTYDPKIYVHGVNEEVEFSEAELEHIAAILEANPVAPTPDDYSPKAFGPTASRSGTLTDEAIAEEEAKRGRGRPKGSKSGSKHGGGAGEGGETKNLAAQIRFASSSGASDGKGNMMLKHPKTGVTKAVSAKAATEFYNKYTNAEKPADKQAHHDEFLAKHFGGEKPKTSGITLPKMPSPKS